MSTRSNMKAVKRESQRGNNAKGKKKYNGKNNKKIVKANAYEHNSKLKDGNPAYGGLRSLLANQGLPEVQTREPGAVKEVLKSITKGDFRSPSKIPGAYQNDNEISVAVFGSDITPVLSDDAISGFSAGLVSRALTKGMPVQYAPGALSRVAKIIKSYAIAGEPLVDSVPGYIGVVTESLKPKKGVFGEKGKYNYAWGWNQPDIEPGSYLDYGLTSTPGRVWYGAIDVDNRDTQTGLPKLVPGVESDTNALNAYPKFLQYMAKMNTSQSLSFDELKQIRKDSSAFAGQTVVDGFSYAKQGGTITRQGSETKINCPPLAVFSQVLDKYGLYNRACNDNSTFGGGPFELSAFTVNHKYADLKRIRKPTFKFIDAESFYYVFFKSIANAIQQYLDSADAQLIFNSAASTPTGIDNVVENLLPKISLLKARIAMRNEMMKVFGDVSSHVQSMGPTNDINETFLGYASGVGTCANFQATPVNLPSYYSENMRALTPVAVDGPNGTIDYFLPVVGSYENEVCTDSDFTITVRGSAKYVNYPIFQQTGGDAVKKSKPAKIPSSPQIMITKKKYLGIAGGIRINDGNTGDGWVALNTTHLISEWSKELNECTLRVAKYFLPLGPNSNQPAANILKLGGTNTFAKRVSNLNDTSFLAQREVTSYSFGFKPNKVVVEQFPMLTGLHIVSNAQDSRQKADNDGETIRIPVDSQNQPSTLKDRADTIALLNNSDGTTTNIERQLDQLSTMGMGGIFSSIAEALQPVVAMGTRFAGTALDGALKC